MTLDELRVKIDTIDNKLLELLNERMEYVNEVGNLKHKDSSPIYRPEREKAIIDRLASQSKGLLSRNGIEAIFMEIFATSRFIENPEKVAYLGPKGSFTHQSAEANFGAIAEYLPMSSIRSVFKALHADRAKYAVVPIENSSDGIVTETLDALGGSKDTYIIKEHYMPIHHAFGTLAEDISQIKKIYSKDIAFGQCQEFLNEHGFDENVEKIAVESTAKAVILATQDKNSAAIASNVACRLYHLPMMFENIEDVHTNKTRFLILSNSKNQPSGNDKSSILVKLDDKAGELAKFLDEFQQAGINLKKIESRPNLDSKNFSYWFYIDFEAHIADERVEKIFKKYEKEIQWLGSYPNSEDSLRS